MAVVFPFETDEAGKQEGHHKRQKDQAEIPHDSARKAKTEIGIEPFDDQFVDAIHFRGSSCLLV